MTAEDGVEEHVRQKKSGPKLTSDVVRKQLVRHSQTIFVDLCAS